MGIKAVIFDLDGVICSTDEIHYKAWRAIADEEGIPFSRKDNERLRGVSRMASLQSGPPTSIPGPGRPSTTSGSMGSKRRSGAPARTRKGFSEGWGSPMSSTSSSTGTTSGRASRILRCSRLPRTAWGSPMGNAWSSRTPSQASKAPAPPDASPSPSRTRGSALSRTTRERTPETSSPF